MALAAASTLRVSDRWARLTRDFAVAAQPRRFLAYLAALTLGAIASLVLTPVEFPADHLVATLGLTVANLVAAQLKVVDSNENSWDLTTVPQIAALLLLPPGAVLFVGVVSTALTEVGVRRPWVRAVFNVSQVTCSLMVGLIILTSAGGAVVGPRDLVARSHWVLLAVAAEQLANKTFVATVIAYYRGGSPLSLWWEINEHVLVTEGSLACSAVLLAFGWLFDGRLAALLTVPLFASWLAMRRGRAAQRAAEVREAIARATQQLREVAEPARVISVSARLLCDLTADAVIVEGAGERAEAARQGLTHENVARLQHSLSGARTPVTLATERRALVDEGAHLGIVQAAWLSSSAIPERRLLLDPLCQAVAAALKQCALLRQAAEVETLREVTQARSDLLAAVSHELHPPLALVVANAESLSTLTTNPNARARASQIATTA